MGLSAQDYLDNLYSLIPFGPAWPREEDQTLGSLLKAMAEELARIDSKSDLLISELDPRESIELLPDFERALGLPDTCTLLADSLQGRRFAVLEKLTRIGGGGKQYFIDLAARHGFVIDIVEFNPFRAGESMAGDEAASGTVNYHWQVITETRLSTVDFIAGESTSGEPLGAFFTGLLECLINRYKPAHTQVSFVYTASDGDILLEDGSYLLAENGDQIVLE